MASNQPRGPSMKRNRLPTLGEVLQRRTAPPVDLYCLYIFERSQGSEDVLDFWLDVHQHENLCRAYFKDLRRSGRSVQEDWPEYYEYAKQRGSIYNPWNGIGKDAGGEKVGNEGKGEGGSGVGTSGVGSAGLDEETGVGRDNQRTPSPRSMGPDPRQSMSGRSHYSPGETRFSTTLSPTLQALYPHDSENSPTSPEGEGQGRGAGGRTSFGGVGGLGRNSSVRTRASKRQSVAPFVSRNTAITRADLLASAERIYARYLVPGAEKEIYLPATLRIHYFPLSSTYRSASRPRASGEGDDAEDEEEDEDDELTASFVARVPDMYHLQKEYVYRQMEQDSFPRFLRAKAFGNLTPVSALVRLGLGLFCLWAGLSTALSFIFLDVGGAKRLWMIIPFALAFLFLLSHSYDLDPILVFLRQSETTPFRTLKIKEPYVRRLLIGRAIWVILLTTVVTAIVVVVFWAIPGRRL